ncbi:MAG: FtsX-like permease family protein, partial [Candidatus Kariarchaeaceae archaeon]
MIIVSSGFSITFALKNIKYFRNKVFLVLIGFIFALSLLTSVIVWANTSERIVIDEFVESTDYFFYVSSFMPGNSIPIAEYLNNESLIEYYDISIKSEIVFNSENKNDTYRFYPYEAQDDPNDPVIVGDVITTNLRGITDHLSKIFDIEGQLPKNRSEILITQQLLSEISQVVNQTLGINSTVDTSIARRIPNVDVGQNQLQYFEKKDFANLTISGIISYNGLDSSASQAYSREAFDRLVIFSLENLDFTDIIQMDRNSLRPNAMVVVRIEALYDSGVNGLQTILNSLKDRILVRFWSATPRILTEAINDLVIEFNFSFNSIYYYLPLVALALLLSNFAAKVLLSDRDEQIAMLRERGATSSDISKLLSIEFIFISLLGIIVGFPIAIILSAIIPSIQPNGFINWELTKIFVQQMSLQFSQIYLMILIVFGVFGIFSGYRIYRKVYEQNHFNEYEQESLERIFKYLKAIITLLLIIGLTLLILEVSKGTEIQEITLDFSFEYLLIITVIVFTIVWIFIAQYLADFVLTALRKLDGLFYKLFPQISFVVNKNFRRKKNNVTLLAFFLIFLLSLLTFATTLDATYESNQKQTDEFLQGADLRIHTSGTYSNFSKILESIEGVERISPLYTTTARIVQSDITVYAIDPSSYLEVGKWKYADASGNINEIIQTLDTNESRVLISETVADRLGYKVGRGIYISGFRNRYIANFSITGLLNSAPGVGLSSSSNPELNQHTGGWAMVPLKYVEANFKASYAELFLGKIQEGYDIAKITEAIKELPGIEDVNPYPINENHIGNIITPFLPSPKAILLFIEFISIIFSIFLISLITETVLNSRKRENAILYAIGISKRQIFYLILGEMMSVIIVSFILGLFYGIILANLALHFFLPLTVKRIFISLVFQINWIQLLMASFGLLTITILVMLLKIRQLFLESPIEAMIESIYS